MHRYKPASVEPLAPMVWPGNNGSIHDNISCHGAVRMTAFGRFYYEHEVDWSLRPYQTYEDCRKHSGLTEHLPIIAKSLGVKQILAPRPEFGRSVAKRPMMSQRIPIKNRLGAGVDLVRGAAADVITLEPGDTYGISAAGCIVGWAYYPGLEEKNVPAKLVAAHMGLRCLVDYNEAIGLSPKHINRSVVDVVMQELGVRDKEQIARIQVGIGFPIEPQSYVHDWEHPGSGKENELLCNSLVKAWGEEAVFGWDEPVERKLGRIDLGYIAREQFKKSGIDSDLIRSTPNYERHMHSDGKPIWYTTRGPFGNEKRNLVLVSRLK